MGLESWSGAYKTRAGPGKALVCNTFMQPATERLFYGHFNNSVKGPVPGMAHILQFHAKMSMVPGEVVS